MVRRRPLALAVALIAIVLSGPAFAKKKKKGGGKRPKTPSGKSISAEPKDTSDADDSSSSADDSKEEESRPAAKSPPPEASDETSSDGEAKEKKPAPKKAAAAESDEDSAGGALPALEFVLGGGAMFRKLAYNDDRSMAVAPYSLAPGPEARVGLEVYPAAFATSGFAANIGVLAQLGYGFGVKSRPAMAGAQDLTTQFMDYAVGLKLRIPLGMAIPYAAVSYGAQAFQLNGQSAGSGPPVPAVGYKFIRAGAGARFVFTPTVDLDVGAAFLLLTDAGQIRSVFWPHTTGNGFEAALSLGFKFTNMIGVRAGVDFRQYGLAFNWRAGEPNQSGGALDRYIVAWGGLQIVLDGMGGGAEEAPAEAPAKSKGKKRKPEPDAESESADEPTE